MKRSVKQTNSGQKSVQVGSARDVTVIHYVEDNGPIMAKLRDALPTVCHAHAFELRERYSAQALHLAISQGALKPDLTSGRLVRAHRAWVVLDYVFGGALLVLCLPFAVLYLMMFAASPAFDAVSALALAQALGVMCAVLFVLHTTIEPQVKAARMVSYQNIHKIE